MADSEVRQKFETWKKSLPIRFDWISTWQGFEAGFEAGMRAGEIAQQEKIADLEHEIEYAHSALGGNRAIHLHDKIYKLKEQLRALPAAPEEKK